MRFPALILAALALAPLPAMAQSQLERMETLSERAGALANEAMVLQAPQLAGQMPSPEWDDPMREAYACVLEGYRNTVGEDGIETMLDDMETALDGATAEQMLNGEMEQMIDMPDGITVQRSTALMSDCGVMALFMERMSEAGMLEAMSE